MFRGIWEWIRWEIESEYFLNPRETVFALVMAFLFALDLLLVECGLTSISAATWVQTAIHPTLIAAGILLTVWIAWLVRESFPAIVLTCILGGHLFVHY